MADSDTPSISPEQSQDKILRNTCLREKEIHDYQVNIDAYTHIKETLDDLNWDTKTAPYRGHDINQLASAVIAGTLTMADLTLIDKLNYKDWVTGMIVTETLRQAGAIRLRAGLSSQITTEDGQTVEQLISDKASVILEEEAAASAARQS